MKINFARHKYDTDRTQHRSRTFSRRFNSHKMYLLSLFGLFTDRNDRFSGPSLPKRCSRLSSPHRSWRLGKFAETSSRRNDCQTALIASYKRCVSEGFPATSVSSPLGGGGGGVGVVEGSLGRSKPRGPLNRDPVSDKICLFFHLFKTRDHIS